MANATLKKSRPKYLSLPALLFEIHLPVSGWVSILHRVSGALLFFPGVLWLLYLLDHSLVSAEGFEHARNYLGLWPVKVGLIFFVWLFCHHFLAGIRHLLLDLHKGIDLPTARASAAAVLALGLALTAWFGVKLW